MQQETRGGRVQVMEEELAAKTLVVEQLSRELEEFRAAFGTEGVQQVMCCVCMRTLCVCMKEFKLVVKLSTANVHIT